MEKVGGGEDWAENVIDGYKIVNDPTKITWKQGTLKSLIHIADAPMHGKHYHDMGADADNLWDSTEEGILESEIELMASKNIRQFLLRLHRSTDKMYDMIHNLYPSYV